MPIFKMILEEHTRNLKLKKKSAKKTMKQTPMSKVTVTFVGEPGVGKSSILRRLRSADFREEYYQTFGVERSQIIVNKPQQGNESVQVNLRFLDTNDTFLDPSLCNTMQDYVDSLHAGLSNFVVIVYDVTDHTSFIEAKAWLKLVRSYLIWPATLVLVGNKCDSEAQREVHKTAGEVLASLNKMKFLEVSAKDHTNMDSLMDILLS